MQQINGLAQNDGHELTAATLVHLVSGIQTFPVFASPAHDPSSM
jgi:hypothetical protein